MKQYKCGDTMGFQLNVYTDYAMVERVAPDNSHVEQDFTYRGGQWQNGGPDTTTLDYLGAFGCACGGCHVGGCTPISWCA